MESSSLLNASCRVALAACLHDLGKFAERAGLEVSKEALEIHLQLYARRNEQGGRFWYSHRHAAYTALAWDLIEEQLPELVGQDVSPFGGWKDPEVEDSAINAAARHHRPDSLLQWIVATADRVASGFEREEFERYNDPDESNNDISTTGLNHISTRQLTLFEQIRLSGDNEHHRGQLRWRHPLAALSPESIFPQEAKDCETSDRKASAKEYQDLWQAFKQHLGEIPKSHRQNWALWLDHFDSAWACFTQSIPAATAFNVRPEVSLYDHSHTTAALATALWRYHHDLGHDGESIRRRLSDRARPDWSEQKLLLIQGDLFGIQNFLFATGGETQKKAAKLLRGRSFHVSLLTECAALRILEALELPPTSQVINAAGKFLIVAPNTQETLDRLKEVQRDIDAWFLEYTWGQTGIGLAWLPAACNDFLRGSKQGHSPFKQLIDRLFVALNHAKAQRLNLCGNNPPEPVFADFLASFDSDKGVCAIDGQSPAREFLDGKGVSLLARDQIDIGSHLAKHERLLISSRSLNHNSLRLPIFGYHIQFTGPEDASGKFGPVARQGVLRRAWDFSAPTEADAPLFHGYARRHINGYVPRFGELNAWEKGRYSHLSDIEDADEPRAFKSLEFIACDDRKPLPNGDKYEGVEALMAFKGDVDNLGSIFEKGLAEPSFAKMAALSRQMNAFFAIWLPWYCKEHYPSTYTIFAGGDDFFLLGPWHSTMRLARDMRQHFARYVAHNPDIHFSAGLAMLKPGLPIRQMGTMTEEALDEAKSYLDKDKKIAKNAVTCFDYSVSWDDFEQLLARSEELEELRLRLELSTGYLYGLQYLADMAQELKNNKPRPESALWNSRFSYRTWRMLERKRGLSKEERQRYQEFLGQRLGGGISHFGSSFKIALFTHLYQHRH